MRMKRNFDEEEKDQGKDEVWGGNEGTRESKTYKRERVSAEHTRGRDRREEKRKKMKGYQRRGSVGRKRGDEKRLILR